MTPTEPEQRRREGMRLLADGHSQTDVARICGVTRQTANTWSHRMAEGEAAWRDGARGRPAALSAADRERLSNLLRDDAAADAFPRGRRTLARTIRLIEREFGVRYSISGVWHLLRVLGRSA